METPNAFRSATYTMHAPVQNCVSVGKPAGRMAVQDTKEKHLGADRTTLQFGTGAWDALLAQLR